MSIAASSLVSSFRKTFPDCTPTNAYVFLNEASKQVIRAYPIRMRDFNLAVTEGGRTIDIDEGIVWIDEARYIPKPSPDPLKTPGLPMDQTTLDTLQTSGFDWRGESPGTPYEFYTTADLTTGELGLRPSPDDTTLTVTGATNASPIVITSSAAHGLSDGDRVGHVDVVGNTAANVEGYAKVTGYGATTYGFYSDSALTLPIAGNGAYTSGGLISCAGSPYIKLYTRHHAALDSSSTMPLTAFYRDTYLNMMRFLYATEMENEAGIKKYRPLVDEVLERQFQLTQKRGGRKEPHLKIVQQRPNGYVTQTRF